MTGTAREGAKPPVRPAGRNSAIPRAARAAAKRLLARLPHTPAFDYLHALAYFLYAHRRWPRRGSGLLNDYLFFLKTGPEMREPLRRITSDKVYAKHFIDGVLGRKATPETHAVFETVDAIRRAELPARCILKPAHGAHYVVVLPDAGTALTEADRERLRRGLATDPYRENREANYRGLRRRIICEELVTGGEIIRDYKLFCYRGRMRVVYVCHRRLGSDAPFAQNFYDRDWTPVDITHNYRAAGPLEERPTRLGEMIGMAEALGAHFELVRVDMYVDGDRIHVGELTHCHNQGNAAFGSLAEERELSRILFA